MSATTLLTIHSDAGRRSFPLVKGSYIIGRDPSCDVAVASLFLAPKHARIHIAEGHFTLEDLTGSERAVTAAGRRFEIPSEVHFGEFTITVGPDAGPNSQALPLETRPRPPGSAKPLISEEAPGAALGSYTLVKLLGEGGFGTVWLANQSAPVRRQVAIKILKPGMNSREILARFEQERQTLARMNHPGIARVFDAGATPQGRPYFIMEWVAGTPVNQFAAERALSAGDRLNLFIQICHAVQHAHQKGVTHRDLKPSNLLVTEVDGRRAPKVIDFGIAKAAAGEKLTDFTLVTRQEQLIGTPAYMSPEQARRASGDVDTRSDIYSLGVVLYELLTGTTPFDEEELSRAGADGMLEIIRDRTPERPSARLRALAGGGRAKPGAIPPDASRLVPGDLDWIVMKCLEKEPGRRYESAFALAEELEAFLEHRPITARPPSLGYLAWRFTQRHQVVVASAAAVLVAIVAGLAFSTNMYWREREARRQADAETEKSRQVALFLKDTLGAVGPSVALGRDTTLMRDILDNTIARMDTELGDRPRVSAELRQVIGRTFTELREFGPAVEQLEQALSLQRSLHASDHPDLAGCLMDYASALEMAGRTKEAEPVARGGLAMWQRLVGPEDIETASAKTLVCWILLKSGRSAEGEAMANEAFRVWLRHPRDERLAEAPKTLATIHQHLGRGEESAAIFAEELRVLKQSYGSEHPAIANCLDNYGVQLVRIKRDAEAETILQEALTMGRKFFGDRSPHEDHVLAGLATLAGRRGDLEAQLDYARQCRAVGGRVYPAGHRYWRESQGNYLRVLLQQAEIHLDRAWQDRNAPSAGRSNVTTAFALIEELKSATELESLLKPERPWIKCLEAMTEVSRNWFAAAASDDENTEAVRHCEQVLETARPAFGSGKAPPSTAKARAAKIDQYLSRLRAISGARKPPGQVTLPLEERQL